MRRLYNKRNYDAAKQQAHIVLSFANQDPKDPDRIVSALHMLLTCYNHEDNYQKIITLFDSYKDFGSKNNIAKSYMTKLRENRYMKRKRR